MSQSQPDRVSLPRLPDLVAAALTVGLGLAVLVWVGAVARGQTIPIFSIREALWFPALLALFLIAAGAGLALRALRGIGLIAEGGLPVGRGLLGAAGLILYSGAVFILGFWIASSLAILGLARLLDQPWRSPWLIAAAALFPGLIQFTFALALSVRLPGLPVN